MATPEASFRDESSEIDRSRTDSSRRINAYGSTGIMAVSCLLMPTYSCTTCRRRKVKCSGTYPCTACVKNQADCIFEQEKKKNYPESYGCPLSVSAVSSLT